MKPTRLAAVVVIPVVLFTAWYINQNNEAKKTGMSSVQLSQLSQRVDHQIKALQKEITLLKQTIYDMRHQTIDGQTSQEKTNVQLSGIDTNNDLEIMETQISQLDERIFALENRNDTVSYSELQHPSQPTAMEDQSQKFYEKTSARFDSYQSNLLQEEVDYKWSNTAISSIDNAFQKPEIADSTVQTMECRSTMCMVQVTHNSEQDMDEFQLWFPSYVNQELPRVAMQHQKDSNGHITTTVYLARKGHVFPNAEQ